LRTSAINRNLGLPLGWFDVLNAVPALVYVITPDAEVTFISDYFYTYTGLPKGALIGTTWTAAIHPDDLEDATASLIRGLAGDEPFKIVQRLRGGDGTYRTYEALTVPVRDRHGRIVQWVGAESDVEEYVKTAELLGESERRMKTLLDTIPQLVWTADMSGRIDWFNTQAYAFTGQAVQEAAVWGWRATIHPDDLPKIESSWPDWIQTGRPFEMEFRLRRHDGVYRWMLSRVAPLRSPAGEVIRWYGSSTDIDAQKRAEQRRERVATLLQEALLPERLPVVDGVRLDALYLPSESDASVGGDWYDAIALGDGRLLLSCGDVTGHGLEAAALAARLRQTIAFAGRERPEPASILERVNAAMIADGTAFATAAVAVFDPATAYFELGLAGHPPPVVAEAERPVRTLSPGGIPLGIDLAASFATYRCTLAPGAIVAFYTDGLIEFDRDLVHAGDLLEVAVAQLAQDATTIEPARFLRDRVFASAGVLRRDDVVVFVLQLAAESPARERRPEKK
jgi:PAS domain S-box-containing protein